MEDLDGEGLTRLEQGLSQLQHSPVRDQASRAVDALHDNRPLGAIPHQDSVLAELDALVKAMEAASPQKSLRDVRRLRQATELGDSEDSEKLNTSFIERLNLTIRQGSAYLCRRTLCYARRRKRLEAHLELLRCYYNFVRPHRALKFGREVRTPAIQAGLTRRRLTLREIFSSTIFLLAWEKVKSVLARCTILVIVDDRQVQLAAG